MILSQILFLFQTNDRQFPEAEYPENNIFDQLPAFGNTLFFVVIMIIIWFGTGIILAYLINRDLKKREVSGISYIIFTLIGSIIGAVIYYIVRYNEKCALEENEDLCILEDDTKDNNNSVQ